MAITSSTNREVQNEYIERRFMEQLIPQLQFFKFAREGQVPGGMGDSVRWLHFPEFDVDTSVLSETDAADNETSSYAAEAVSGSISPYGQYIKISEQQAKTMVTGGLDQISERLSFAGAKTVDTLLRNAAYGTSSYFKVGQTVPNTGVLTSSHTLNAACFSFIEASLLTSGTTGFASEGGKFVAILHPTPAAQLRAQSATSNNDVTWFNQNVNVPGTQGQISNGDLGAISNIALKQSPLITAVGSVETSGQGGASATVSGYRNVVLANDGLGRAGLDDMQPQVKIKKPGPNDTSQPLDTYWTYGVKFRAAHKLLSSKRCIVLYSYST